MLSFFEFNQIIDQKTPINEALDPSVVAKMNALRTRLGASQPAQVEPAQATQQGMDQLTAPAKPAGGLADKLAALKKATSAVPTAPAAGSAPKLAPPPGTRTPKPGLAPRVNTKPDVNDPAVKDYDKGSKTNQMGSSATADKDLNTVNQYTAEIQAFNQNLASITYQGFAREEMKKLGLPEPPPGRFSLQFSPVTGEDNEILIPDIFDLMAVVRKTKHIIEYGGKKAGSPTKFNDFRTRLQNLTSNAQHGAAAMRALKFEKVLHSPEFLNQPAKMSELANNLAGKGGLGGLEMKNTALNMAALQLMIAKDVEGKFGIFKVDGNPADGNAMVTVLPLKKDSSATGSAEDQEIGSAVPRAKWARPQNLAQAAGLESTKPSEEEAWMEYYMMMEASGF